MSLKCGIVGLPNVGKSTLFNALTNAAIAAENYPFCTIEPNIGIVEVPDSRLKALSEIVHPERIQSAIVEFVDIAGLVAGASEGAGLGNKFLANIRETDAIINVVRCFDNDDVIHVNGKVDPIDDTVTITTELILADMATIQKVMQNQKKKTSGSLPTIAVLERLLPHLNEGNPARTLALSTDELSLLKPLCLLTLKPAMYVANVSEAGFTHNPYLDKLTEYAKTINVPLVAICASIEAEISVLDENDKLEFLHDMGMQEAGLNRLIQAAYQLLGLQTYFTAGVKEVRAWTVKVGATAAQGAGVIHTDFERGFIRAEVIAYNDFIQYKGEQGAASAGKMRLEGKDYLIKDGDVMHFRFNV